MRFTLDAINETDAPALARIAARTFRDAYAGVHTPADIDSYVAKTFTREWAATMLDDPNCRCVVAARGTEWLGFYILRAACHAFNSGGDPMELKQIYILRDAYGRGLGGALFDDAVATSQAAGHDRLWLAVSVRNERARGFYAKRQFRELGPGPTFHVGRDRLASTIMERPLTPP